MLFPTRDYLVFLPVAVLLYWATPARLRLWVLAVASVFFYASWHLSYLPVLLGIAGLAWALGRGFSGRQGRVPLATRVGSTLVLLLPLLAFKYWDWIAGDLNLVAQSVGINTSLPTLAWALPVGISFFTFQALAYVIDVRRDGEAERSPLVFGTFLAFFPQLVAGPIVRRHELLPQMRNLPMLSQGDIGFGVYRIAQGMAKKVLIADVLRVGMVDPMFTDPARFTGLELLIGLYAYTIQIYCDFSGYTDIAIGSARLFGLKLPENFNRPYKATSAAGFWRRWHMTLSNWVRDYVYFPLGGARAGSWRVTFNIMATLLIIGMWHGASWNFVIYGLLHGSAVAINRVIRKQTGRRPDDPMPHLWGWAWRFLLTFHFVVFARILFRAPDLPGAWEYTMALGNWSWVMPRFAPTVWGMFVLGYLLHFTPDHWRDQIRQRFVAAGPLGWALGCAMVGALCVLLGTGEQLSFVYYEF